MTRDWLHYLSNPMWNTLGIQRLGYIVSPVKTSDQVSSSPTLSVPLSIQSGHPTHPRQSIPAAGLPIIIRHRTYPEVLTPPPLLPLPPLRHRNQAGEIPADAFLPEPESYRRFLRGLVERCSIVLDADKLQLVKQEREDEMHGVRVHMRPMIPWVEVDEGERSSLRHTRQQ